MCSLPIPKQDTTFSLLYVLAAPSVSSYPYACFCLHDHLPLPTPTLLGSTTYNTKKQRQRLVVRQRRHQLQTYDSDTLVNPSKSSGPTDIS